MQEGCGCLKAKVPRAALRSPSDHLFSLTYRFGKDCSSPKKTNKGAAISYPAFCYQNNIAGYIRCQKS